MSLRTPSFVRRAFSLVELIVVVGIIAVLCAMIFVAIQKLRGSAAQTQCINNLKQISFAAQQYYDANEKLPPGYSNQTKAGVLMYLLPYIEQNAASAILPVALTKGSGGFWYGQVGLGADSPVSARVANYECPAAGLYSATYANGTVKYETIGSGASNLQLTLKQMLAHSDPTIRAMGQKIADNLNQIYYAAWATQTLVWQLSDFGAKQGSIKLNFDGGSVTVVGGAAGTTGLSTVNLGGVLDILVGQTYTGGTVWAAQGSFVANGQKIDVSLVKPSLYFTMKKGGGFEDRGSYVAPGYNIVPAGHYYDNSAWYQYPAAYVAAWEAVRQAWIVLGLGDPGPPPNIWTVQDGTLIDKNPAAVSNQIVPIVFGTPLTMRPQDNDLFWKYYEATYGLTYTYSLPGNAPGFTLTPNDPIDATMGRTNYVGNSGSYGFNAGTTYSAGPFYPDSAVTWNDVQDGLSNTIAFGEALGGQELPSRDYALTWMGAGVMPSYWDCQTPAKWFTFGSGHPTGVNFAFCDGSVRTIKKVAASAGDTASTPPANVNTPRWAVFQQLAGTQDHASPDLSLLD